MKKKIIFLSLILLIAGACDSSKSKQAIVTQINVLDFGVDVKSENNHDALVALFDFVKKMNKPVEVIFIKNGTYRVGLKNGDISDDKKHAIVVEGIDNLIINGQGATIMITNPEIGAVRTERCNNIEVKNLIVDYETVPFTQGTITAINKKEYWFELLIDSDFPEPDQEQFEKSKTRNANWGLTVREMKNGRKSYGPTAILADKWEKQDTGVWRFYPTKSWAGYTDSMLKSGLKIGDKYVHMARNWSTCFAAINCDNVLWDNITIYAAPNVTFYPHITSNHIIRNCHVKVKEGRILSANGDGIHMRSSRGNIIIEGCTFSGMADDGINMHSSALSIQGQPAKNQVLIKKHSFSVIQGDELVLVRSSNAKVLGKVIVKTVKDVGSNLLITFEKDLPELITGNGFNSSDNMYNLSEIATPFVIKNCKFNDYRGRGILVSTQGGIIENNIFNLNEGWAITFMYETSSWAEGPIAKDIIIRNNEFRTYEVKHQAAIFSKIFTHSGSKPTSRLFRNIKIKNNIFYDYVSPVIELQNANGVEIINNEVECVKNSSSKPSELPTILLMNSENVRINNFTVTDTFKQKRIIVEIDEDCEAGDSIIIENLNLDVSDDCKPVLDKRVEWIYR